MKFGKAIRAEARHNRGLSFVNFKYLKRILKRWVSAGRSELWSVVQQEDAHFHSVLQSELKKVGDSFWKELEQISFFQNVIRSELPCLDIQPNPEIYTRMSFEDLQTHLQSLGGLNTLPTKDAALTATVRSSAALCKFCVNLGKISSLCKRLRRCVLWNAVAVVKILKKRQKNITAPMIDALGTEPDTAARVLSTQEWYRSPELARIVSTVETTTGELMQRLTGRPPSRDEYQCPICLDVVLDPVCLRTCGHRFCWACLCMAYCEKPEGTLERCPCCRAAFPLDPEAFEVDGILNRFLKNFFPEVQSARFQEQRESLRKRLEQLNLQKEQQNSPKNACSASSSCSPTHTKNVSKINGDLHTDGDEEEEDEDEDLRTEHNPDALKLKRLMFNSGVPQLENDFISSSVSPPPGSDIPPQPQQPSPHCCPDCSKAPKEERKEQQRRQPLKLESFITSPRVVSHACEAYQTSQTLLGGSCLFQTAAAGRYLERKSIEDLKHLHKSSPVDSIEHMTTPTYISESSSRPLPSTMIAEECTTDEHKGIASTTSSKRDTQPPPHMTTMCRHQWNVRLGRPADVDQLAFAIPLQSSITGNPEHLAKLGPEDSKHSAHKLDQFPLSFPQVMLQSLDTSIWSTEIGPSLFSSSFLDTTSHNLSHPASPSPRLGEHSSNSADNMATALQHFSIGWIPVNDNQQEGAPSSCDSGDSNRLPSYPGMVYKPYLQIKDSIEEFEKVNGEDSSSFFSHLLFFDKTPESYGTTPCLRQGLLPSACGLHHEFVPTVVQEEALDDEDDRIEEEFLRRRALEYASHSSLHTRQHLPALHQVSSCQ